MAITPVLRLLLFTILEWHIILRVIMLPWTPTLAPSQFPSPQKPFQPFIKLSYLPLRVFLTQQHLPTQLVCDIILRPVKYKSVLGIGGTFDTF